MVFGGALAGQRQAATTPGSLDRNNNGTIVHALAEYYKPSGGGNGEGQIDSRDSVFSSLHL